MENKVLKEDFETAVLIKNVSDKKYIINYE